MLCARRGLLQVRGQQRCFSASPVSLRHPITLAHQIPAEQTDRIYSLPKSKILEAKALVKEDPNFWTPNELAKKFSVPVPVIMAHVPRPTRRMRKIHYQLNKELGDPNPARRPNQQRLHDWVQSQTAKSVQQRELRRQWKRTGNYERLNNIDIPWLVAIEKRIGVIQEKAINAIAEARKARKEKL